MQNINSTKYINTTKKSTSQAPNSAPHLERRAGYFRHRYSLNSLKITLIQILLNPTNALWKDLILFRLNLILNTNQSIALFRQAHILRSTRHKNLQKQNNEDVFRQLLNTWLHFTSNKFPTSTHIEETLDQPIFLNSLTKLHILLQQPIFLL